MKYIIILYIILVPVLSFAQNQYPVEVEAVLKQTKNRSELEKVIDYFGERRDSVKLKAAYFLISNMDIHYSANYYWADSSNSKIDFDELSYPDFAASIKAFDSLKNNHSKIHPVSFTEKDIDVIKADFLIGHINKIFDENKNTKIDQHTFFEYVLPYRISVEPLQDWETVYRQKFAFVRDSSKQNFDTALLYLKRNMNRWFTCTWNLEKRNEPLPRLGALQLLQRKKGACEDVAGLTTFALRSQGIPASIDYVPYWATAFGNHFLNVAFTPASKPVAYDVLLNGDSISSFVREPAKVLRTTYSKQRNTLPFFLSKDNIPEGFLQTTNYVDVTNEYWQTKDIRAELVSPLLRTTDMLPVYACVFNNGKWQPVWWGISYGNSVTFTNMCKGAVFMPMFYNKGRLIVAGYPIANGYNNTEVLKPDTVNTRTITINEQEKYLKFRPKKKYKLLYWNKNWKLIAEKTFEENTLNAIGQSSIVFDKVPKNALLLLIPEYSQGKERPFVILADGKRVWW